jgi:hypothetical protein
MKSTTTTTNWYREKREKQIPGKEGGKKNPDETSSRKAVLSMNKYSCDV